MRSYSVMLNFVGEKKIYICQLPSVQFEMFFIQITINYYSLRKHNNFTYFEVVHFEVAQQFHIRSIKIVR